MDVLRPHWLVIIIWPSDSMPDVSIHIDQLRTGLRLVLPPETLILSADCLHAAGPWDPIKGFSSLF